MNSVVREALQEAMQDRSPDDLVFTSNHNSVNEYSLRWGFEEACHRAGIVYGETKRGGIIWHDLRRAFATRLRANGVQEYDIKISWAMPKPGSQRFMLAPRLHHWKPQLPHLQNPAVK